MILANFKPPKITLKEDIAESFFNSLDKKQQVAFLNKKLKPSRKVDRSWKPPSMQEITTLREKISKLNKEILEEEKLTEKGLLKSHKKSCCGNH